MDSSVTEIKQRMDSGNPISIAIVNISILFNIISIYFNIYFYNNLF